MGDIELPPLTAVVTEFVQAHLDPEHDPVEGMLGMVGRHRRRWQAEGGEAEGGERRGVGGRTPSATRP